MRQPMGKRRGKEQETANNNSGDNTRNNKKRNTKRSMVGKEGQAEEELESGEEVEEEAWGCADEDDDACAAIALTLRWQTSAGAPLQRATREEARCFSIC